MNHCFYNTLRILLLIWILTLFLYFCCHKREPDNPRVLKTAIFFFFPFQVFSKEHYTEIDYYPNSNSCGLHSSWLSCNRHLEEQEYRKHSITFSKEALEKLLRHQCSLKKNFFKKINSYFTPGHILSVC